LLTPNSRIPSRISVLYVALAAPRSEVVYLSASFAPKSLQHWVGPGHSVLWSLAMEYAVNLAATNAGDAGFRESITSASAVMQSQTAPAEPLVLHFSGPERLSLVLHPADVPIGRCVLVVYFRRTSGTDACPLPTRIVPHTLPLDSIEALQMIKFSGTYSIAFLTAEGHHVPERIVSEVQAAAALLKAAFPQHCVTIPPIVTHENLGFFHEQEKHAPPAAGGRAPLPPVAPPIGSRPVDGGAARVRMARIKNGSAQSGDASQRAPAPPSESERAVLSAPLPPLPPLTSAVERKIAVAPASPPMSGLTGPLGSRRKFRERRPS
jgi:hypothetical protein